MKTSRTAVIVAFAAAGLFSGCQKWNERNVPIESPPATYSELETRAVQGTAAASPTPQTPTNPRKAYELYSKAVKDGDYEACWRLLSRGTQKMYDSAALSLRTRVLNAPGPVPADLDLLHAVGLTAKEVNQMDGKTLLAAMFRRENARNPQQFLYITRTEFDHEVESGDQARVYVRADGKLEPNPMRLVREGGIWHFDLTKPASDAARP